MRILHICAGWQRNNGAAVIARLIADEQRAHGEEVRLGTWASVRDLCAADIVWVHCGWLPCLWWASLFAKRLIRMPEACYDPVRLAYHGWKKRLVRPIERLFLRKAEKVVATCAVEGEWIRAYARGNREQGSGIRVEVTDIKRFFKLEGFGDQTKAPPRGALREYAVSPRSDFRFDRLRTDPETLHLLYLGRRHPLKGVEYLEKAVEEIRRKEKGEGRKCGVELRIVSNAVGEELEKVWEWCDVLALPTLSENFGLVVAEALERGKRVVTTDGAPVWEGQPGVIYLKGFREGTDEERVELLVEALRRIK